MLGIAKEAHRKPKRPSIFFRTLVRLFAIGELSGAHFKYRKINMEKLGRREPALILMNHSSFIDLKIASKLLYPRPYNIVCTSDGFVGKENLMYNLGCIPTYKFITDVMLVRDMIYAAKKLHSSILMYPEASYSFDGTATPLPDSIGACVKLLGLSVILIHTYGAFSHDPLYNGLRIRKVDVSADEEYLLSPDEVKSLTADEITELIRKRFTFDSFKWQKENGIRIDEDSRAEGLSRVLYKCPHCMTEGRMTASGIGIKCGECGKSYTLDEYGYMRADDGVTEFDHIPDWYAWERRCVRDELSSGTYKLDVPVDIRMMVDKKSIYRVGEGRLVHTSDGFVLDGCGGELHYEQKPESSYGLYADYFWYEIGDMICIGVHGRLYYCFPKSGGDVVAKTRLAVEELYKMRTERKANV